MRISLKRILKTLLYGFFLLAAFLLAWITSGFRDGKLTGGLSLPSAPQAHADTPVGSDTGSQSGSDTGCAGCAGSGDGEGGEGGGEGGSGEGSGDGSG